MTDLYRFQDEAVEYHLNHHYTLNCSEMGLGKSRMALLAAKKSGLKVAVFGPEFLRQTWVNEGRSAGVEFDYFAYSKVHHRLPLSGYGFWIADEVHYLKTPTARRTHSFYSYLKTHRPEYFVGLSGTPIKNRLPDFWTLLAFCSLNPKDTNGLRLEGDNTKYFSFCRKFCMRQVVSVRGCRIEKFGGIKPFMIDEFKGLLEKKYIRFTAEKVLQQLPAMTRKDVFLDMEPVPELAEQFERYMEGSKADTSAKSASAALKARLTAKYALNLLEDGAESLVIFSDHREPTKIISEAIPGAVAITGATPSKRRAEYVEKFQKGKIKVLVATIGSMAVGVTLHRSRNIIFNDLSWVPADNLQAEKRIHRIGQEYPCVSHTIISSPTDSYISKTLFEKMKSIEEVVK